MYATKNVTGTDAVLLSDSTLEHRIARVNMANVHATDSADVDLYVTDGTNTYYIIKKVSIPAGATLVIDGNDISYQQDVYSLYIKLGAGGSTVDVIVRI